MLICVCGEPTEIIRQTILAAKRTADVYTKKINPQRKPRVVVLNDGKVARKENWREILELCRELNIQHIARKIPGGFKAGNINNALTKLQTKDPRNTIDIVLDADYAALPKFLTEITKPFVSDTIDFIQTPQRYRNEKTWIAKAANAHQINFFQYYCESKADDNALFLCGTNFAVRREALNAVNGMDARFITEDYATAIKMHLAGKRGGFIKEPLAKGIAPATLKDYFNQQRRWAKGTFDTTFAFLPQFIWGPMNLKQKLHYLIASTYYLIGIRNFILLIAPMPYLFFNASIIKADNLLLYLYIPILMFNFFTSIVLVRQPIKSLVLSLITFPVFSSAFVSSIFHRKLGFVVTTKKYERENIFVMYKIQLIICMILTIGLIFHITRYPSQGYIAIINYFWTAYDILCLTIGFGLMVKENYMSKFYKFVYSKVGSKKLADYRLYIHSLLTN